MRPPDASVPLRWQSLQHLMRSPKPWPLTPSQVAGHRRLLIEHLLRPFAGFGVASLGGQQVREIQVSLRQRRRDRYLPEERLGFFFLSGLRVGVGEQSSGALEIVVGLFRRPRVPGRVTRPRRRLTGWRKLRAGKRDQAYRRGRRWLCRMRLAPTGACRRPCKGRRVLHSSPPTDCRESPLPVRAMRLRRGKTLKDWPTSPMSGSASTEKIDNRAERTEKQDDKNPVGIRPPPNEVDDRQSLEDDAPRIQKVA